MSASDIFLSYARHDRGTARLFAEGLAEEGFSVWWDASLRSGETFDEVIERNLRDAKAVIVLWSPASVASRWVRAEATLADRRDKLVPAIIEPCDLPIIFELKHAAELCGWTGDLADPRWRTFMSDLERLIDVDSREAPPATPPAKAAAAPAAAPPPEPSQPPPPGNEAVAEPLGRDPVRASAAPELVAVADSEVHCLEIEPGELIGDPVVVNASSMKIGRSAPADIVLPHKSVSREHCVVGLANDELFVTDLNSTNGTYIDGARISRATILPVGSVLQVGQVSLKHAVRTGAQGASSGAFRKAITGGGGLQAPRLAAAS